MCISSVWGYSVHFRFLTTLYLGKDNSQNETEQNVGLVGKYLMYVKYFRQVKCKKGTFDCQVFMFIFWSFGAFPILDAVVSQKWLVIERNRPKFRPQG